MGRHAGELELLLQEQEEPLLADGRAAEVDRVGALVRAAIEGDSTRDDQKGLTYHPAIELWHQAKTLRGRDEAARTDQFAIVRETHKDLAALAAVPGRERYDVLRV